ncbi:LysR family transcriptional regulator [Yoonia sp. F2084L]|uniref:LysR family transcriptional regulator n=1 Tax=Yoonia sp. F2084L TaxID=2926419 RepID=UPI001FF61B0B|nr:LysR family transcriptional regulator [Yoonia sp. F2084L]MCK0096599.1 LysR family transcriptional regulator [Yoonia sp. F2084L]
MNWQAVSFDWNQVRAFLATAEEGSLSAAARALGSTQPTLGRQVSALEADLGVTLFERAGRSLVITTAGQDLLEHVQAMGDAASRISMVASGQSEDVAGHVSVTASDLLAAGFLPPVLKKLREDAPGIIVDIVASNRIENLTRRDADIAIRHVRPDQPDLIARQLTDATAGYYAATEYLDRYGRPQTATDLKNHVFVGPRDTTQMLEFLSLRGIDLSPAQFKANSDSGVVMWELMRAGLGIVVGPTGLWPETKGVERVMTHADPIAFPVWLATHRELRTSRRIRVVFDALAEAFTGSGHATLDDD